MSKSASMKCKLIRNRGKNDSFRAAVDRSYNDMKSKISSPSNTKTTNSTTTNEPISTAIQSTERPRSISAKAYDDKLNNNHTNEHRTQQAERKRNLSQPNSLRIKEKVPIISDGNTERGEIIFIKL